MARVNAIFTVEYGWLFREQPTDDYGIDAHVEVVDEEEVTGRLIALQIKAGASYFEEKNSEGFVFRGKAKHRDYWIHHSLPVVVVLYDKNSHKAYWEAVEADKIEETPKGFKLTVPRGNELTESSKPKLARLAEGDPYQLRLRGLALDVAWMQLLDDGWELFLYVEEWMHKSSGRGSLTLTAIAPDGREQEQQNWPFIMLPGRDYAEALPALFPWADLEIDESTYDDEEYDRFELEEGIWDSEDQKYFIDPEDVKNWRAVNGLSGLRPYGDDGKVAFWKLRLELNDLGRSFLILNGYLKGDASQ